MRLGDGARPDGREGHHHLTFRHALVTAPRPGAERGHEPWVLLPESWLSLSDGARVGRLTRRLCGSAWFLDRLVAAREQVAQPSGANGCVAPLDLALYLFR